MDELILFPSAKKTENVIEHFFEAAIESFQNTDVDQVLIKTNVEYTYSPSINDFSELLTDPDYRTFKHYLAEHPVVRLEQGLIAAHSKQRIDKEGISKTKTKKCSFTFVLHENGTHYRLKISDEIKEGVKFNVRVLEAFTKRFEIVEPLAVNQPVVISLGKELLSQLKAIQETLASPSLQPIGSQLTPQNKELSEVVAAKPVSDNAGLIQCLTDPNQSLFELNANRVTSRDSAVTAGKFYGDSLENIVAMAVKRSREDIPLVEAQHSSKEKEIRQTAVKPSREHGSDTFESWIWKLLAGSAWISSLVFLVMCIYLSLTHWQFEWQLLLPWAGFLIVYIGLLIAYRSRKNQ